MKFKLYDELLDDNNIISHVFMESTPHDVIKKIAAANDGKSDEEVKATEIEIMLLINGHSIDPKQFFLTMWAQYSGMVEKEAKKLVKQMSSDKMQEIAYKINEQAEIVESWANEINWEVENPFIKKS